MKKILAFFLLLSLYLVPSSRIYADIYRQPIKRLTADQILSTLLQVSYGNDIRTWEKKYTPPIRKLEDNWIWEHKENGTLLRLYFSSSYLVFRAAIQEIGYSPEDATARTEILAEQFIRRFGPPIQDEILPDNIRARTWSINDALFFAILSNSNEANILYVMQPKQ